MKKINNKKIPWSLQYFDIFFMAKLSTRFHSNLDILLTNKRDQNHAPLQSEQCLKHYIFFNVHVCKQSKVWILLLRRLYTIPLHNQPMRTSSTASGRRSPLVRGSAPPRPHPEALQAVCFISLACRGKKQQWPKPWAPHTAPWSANVQESKRNPAPPLLADSHTQKSAHAMERFQRSLRGKKPRVHHQHRWDRRQQRDTSEPLMKRMKDWRRQRNRTRQELSRPWLWTTATQILTLDNEAQWEVKRLFLFQWIELTSWRLHLQSTYSWIQYAYNWNIVHSALHKL